MRDDAWAWVAIFALTPVLGYGIGRLLGAIQEAMRARREAKRHSRMLEEYQKAERLAQRAKVVEEWADGVERRKWVRALMGAHTSPVDEMRDWR
jgi:membrane protein required for beta-lactamase induction